MDKLIASLQERWRRWCYRWESHLRGFHYRQKWECLYDRHLQEAALYSQEMERKDARIHELEQIKADLVDQTIARWVGEYLQDKGYWLRLFQHVLSQPAGQRLWIEVLFQQVDNLSEEERLELFYSYLKSRGAEIKIEFRKPVDLPPIPKNPE